VAAAAAARHGALQPARLHQPVLQSTDLMGSSASNVSWAWVAGDTIVIPSQPGTAFQALGNDTGGSVGGNIAAPTTTDEHSIEGVVCTATPGYPGGYWFPNVIVFIIVGIVLVVDYVTMRRTAPSADATGPASDGQEKLLKPGDADEKVDDGKLDPQTIDWKGYLLIAITVVPGFVGDTYFTMLAPFLPGVVDLRGMSNVISGLIFGCQPLGSVFTAPVVSWALRQPWGDPYVMLRLSSAFTAVAISVTGLLGVIPTEHTTGNQVLFTVLICLMRFMQGCCVTVMQVCNGQITLMLLPRERIGPVQGIIQAVRILGVIAGPPLGGVLYANGCWALPFTIGGILLVISAITLNLGLGRRAPQKMHAPPNSMTMWQLFEIGDTWIVIALPMFMVCMETSFMEPAWQPFLGRPPFRMLPVEIGAFLNAGVIVYMAVIIVGGFLISIFGPGLQYVGGAIFSGLGLYLIGPSPWFGGALPQTQIVVLLGYMLSNAGVAVFVPCMTPLALEVFDRAGYTQKQVAGASSAMFTMMVCSANFIGPPLGGALIDIFSHMAGQSQGVPWTTTVYATAVIIVSSLSLFRIRTYARPKSKMLARSCGYEEESPVEPPKDKNETAE